ncbi:hypothetical protein CANMA_001117 [Candida margitis]|uniref:uncharacterized protein n=1 Tax=Candida margitis TaxID=1775924 RepID=UPI0022270103|nr:uncharacterized protein CANMA_001117 [Candida margitis]KAI5969827.1 hypothetical protein CANMA_001117 [Candida margitis]
MPRSFSTSSFNLQQPPPTFTSLARQPRIPHNNPSLTSSSFWINAKENLNFSTSSSSSSSSNQFTDSTITTKLGIKGKKERTATYRRQQSSSSCESKLKRMMMEDENYSFILNPCCDKIDCKFVKHGILKDSKTRNLSMGSFVASLISIDSEEDEASLSHQIVADDVDYDAESLIVAPLRTTSVEQAIQFNQPPPPGEPKNVKSQLGGDHYRALFNELNSSINSINLQAQFDEQLSKLKKIIRGRKNRKAAQ